MYKKLIGTAKEIVQVANEREAKLDDKNILLNKKIEEILEQLELDEIITLQAIMYLGRDRDYNPELTPEEKFLDYKKELQSGVQSKQAEINHMIRKMPLGKYIIDGYSILGIDLMKK